jgi:glycerophosphoryl diester phosphodiesterase
VASNPLIVGHRGSSSVAPENTLAAFARSIRDGADGIEFDVRLSRDGVPVVIHDATLRRTGLVDGIVRELTAAELQQIDVGSWFNAQSQKTTASFAGEKLPTLIEVFDLYQSNPGLLYVEMKCDAADGPELAAQVIKLCRQARMADRVVVESFDLAAIAEIKRIDAEIRTAALFEPKLSRPISTVRRIKMADRAIAANADEIALHHTLAGPRVIEKAKRDGLDVVVWTVEDSEWIARARALGVKALITNDPAIMLRHRNTSA